jgi:hypothetical protein
MATNWPNSVQTFTNPTAGSPLNSPSHADQHITVNDTVEALQNYAGLVLLRTVTPGTGVSSVTVTNVFNNNFRNYKILYSGGFGSTIAALNLQLGSLTTGYYYAYRYLIYATGGQSTQNGNNVSIWVNPGEISAGNGNMMDCTLFAPNIASPTGITWHGSFQSVVLWGGGRQSSTTPQTDFTIKPASGTMSGGLLQVYGFNAF